MTKLNSPNSQVNDGVSKSCCVGRSGFKLRVFNNKINEN